ncbi:OB-fold domain-containing protein [Streptomyces sp. BH-SS-21]|uniref:OB-fold domain-containing protein n=1 Tax=Streptomyces liliiviolaceus TaxID=2823109 RepID=A0A941BEN4_9ACTN|nr:OB-fold domain-containing protein [Streptomyces liliiviolaceus]MBQ0850769.1 OB-fold domain-containing protein [Streptomyces liliiviolaceus]
MDTTTADASLFWDRAAQGELVFQHCDDCAFVRWPAAGVCPECLGRGFTWKPVAPTGTVWSQVVYHRAYDTSLRERIPYNVALVELTCGVRLLTRLTGFGTADPVGAAVTARFEDTGDGPVPVFAPATGTFAPAAGTAEGNVS